MKKQLAKIKLHGDWTELGIIRVFIMPLPGLEAYIFNNANQSTLIFNLEDVHIIKEL